MIILNPALAQFQQVGHHSPKISGSNAEDPVKEVHEPRNSRKLLKKVTEGEQDIFNVDGIVLSQKQINASLMFFSEMETKVP